MATNEEIYNALALLKSECKETHGCNNCNIKKMLNGNCTTSLIPSDWEIRKPRRFTVTDILWAKAAKASGAKEILKHDEWAKAYTDSEQSNDGMVVFPTFAFQSIEQGETVSINEILKEENIVEDKE